MPHRALATVVVVALAACNRDPSARAPARQAVDGAPVSRTGEGVDRTVDDAVLDLSTSDPILRDQTIALLVSYGTRATAAILPLLDSDDVELRSRAARVLAYIADPTTADRLAALLDDASPFVRSHAAYGLFAMNDPRALEALIETIDDFPSATMYPATQSTGALYAMGAAVLPRVAELLDAPSTETRARARLVIVQVAGRMPPDQAAEWLALVAQKVGNP